MIHNAKHVFTYTLPIRWTDIDGFDVVHHSKYLVYMEEARWNWFYSKPQEPLAWIFLVVEANVRYKKALKYPGEVIIKLYAEEPGPKSWKVHHEIFAASAPETICAEGSVTFVCYDTKEKKVIPITEDLKQHFPK